MPRLVLFFLCLTVLGFSVSPRAGLWLGAATAVVWAAWAVLAVAQVMCPPALGRHARSPNRAR